MIFCFIQAVSNTVDTIDKTGLAGTKRSKAFYEIEVPVGSTLTVTIKGCTSGDPDLYVKAGAKPSTDSYDCRPYKNGCNEECVITPTQNVVYHIMIRGYTAFEGLHLLATGICFIIYVNKKLK